MTGLEAFDLFYAVTHQFPMGSTIEINPLDACDLAKLTSEMLVSRGFAEEYAEHASSSLLAGDVTVFGNYMGLSLTKRRWAPLLQS